MAWPWVARSVGCAEHRCLKAERRGCPCGARPDVGEERCVLYATGGGGSGGAGGTGAHMLLRLDWGLTIVMTQFADQLLQWLEHPGPTQDGHATILHG